MKICASYRGFTIIELVIVMAIIGIMALLMAPALGEWATGFRLRGATKDLADALQSARLKAISTGNQYRVQLNINNGDDSETFVLQQNNPTTGWTNEGASITLPTGVNIDNIDGVDAGIVRRTFNTNGTATGWAAGNATSTIFLENQRNDQYRVVISQTGVMRMREGW